VLEVPEAAGRAFNIGSGQAFTVCEVANMMAAMLGKPLAPEICGEYRAGDIRHCFADITQAQRVLGYQPAVTLEDGLVELAEWLREQTADDRVAQARGELAIRGLTV
jgi:dTDP-L-rhamnose 4-epimerase